MLKARQATMDDFDGWIALAGEVEPLFGPMVDDAGFREGLRQAISGGHAFCMRAVQSPAPRVLPGGIVISPAHNEILWFAVAQAWRGQGAGRVLLREALSRLDHDRPISVTTFDDTVDAGLPARRLYQTLGFQDSLPGGMNPAGIPTVPMVLEAGKSS